MPSLSVLDQSVAVTGRTEDTSIRETLALAQHCEALGYRRFWVSEHHSNPAIVGSAPEILMAAIAATTQRIRVGSAGVMLPHYAALKVAEQFRVLEALAPGRIDLGVGRAPGSDFHTAQLLNADPNQSAENFPVQVRELQAWVSGADLPEGHPGRGVTANPTSPSSPELWMLGSSNYGAQLAAHYGLPYAFAHFITDGQGAAQALDVYRQMYRPSPRHPKPQAVLCVWALAADTEGEAWHHFSGRERWKIDRKKGALGPLLSPAEVAQRPYDVAEQAQAEQLRRTALVGSGAQVADKLSQLADSLQVDELAVITWTHDAAARRRSYELLAGQLL
ncbi:luciferase family oxidoreductase, group 1 [Polaromonas sp. OV174]|uniref:LLM class flavin-dependent oxidoreductase n=1 Tax=Polaromonas sp. OV174 TaxID=1855300 RepID=UPI0008E8EEFB|nr:LLM class flavin-dependent oxidoreductase [Polaromonas sp. OV174]SFC49036.1 luciferase family oxidoreductase, group 1 [Polaromonas sp. OV174]